MKNLHILPLLLVLFIGCDHKQSLQEYLVEKENNSEFITASIPTSLIFQTMDSLSLEDKTSLQKIEKINLVALTKAKAKSKLDVERRNLKSILSDEKYKSLLNFNGGDREAHFYYIGTESKVDELIFFGHDSDKGLMLLRMRGKQIEPNDIYKITQSAQRMDMNSLSDNLSGLFGAFNE